MLPHLNRLRAISQFLHFSIPPFLNSSTPKILLVDDDPVSLRIIRRALETAGMYEIRTATTGANCLMEARSFRPDLIVSDKVMPHMDGLEFCRRVKTDPSLSSTLFVILSGVTD